MLVDRCPGKETRDSWIDSFATGKPYELGLHKRGRNYHVSLGWDAKPRLYKTDPLTSLRLPGKALAIVVGKWNAAGEMQAMIDAIEITRVSE